MGMTEVVKADILDTGLAADPVGAMTAAVVSFHTGLAGAGVPAAMLAGALVALVFGIAVIVFRADQVLTGLIIVAFADGLTGVVGRPYMFEKVAGFRNLDLGPLSDIPWLGPILFQQDILVYAAAALAVAVWWGLDRSDVGLRLRAVGEDPATADIAGVNVQLFRLSAVVLGGALCGLAGAYLALASSRASRGFRLRAWLLQRLVATFRPRTTFRLPCPWCNGPAREGPAAENSADGSITVALLETQMLVLRLASNPASDRDPLAS